jgi:WS/DGAT/MGAT family acyltransferase
MVDRMSPLDTYFVLTEGDGVNHMHVGGFATVRGTAPGPDRMLAHVAGKLPLIPRYRQVLQTVPLQLARPTWVDAQHFDLRQHVRFATLPTPGRAALRAFLADLLSERLDRSRPLWELWVVDGFGADEWVVFWKLHHCMIDGVSGTELLTVLFDPSPQSAPPVADTWQPRPAPGTFGVLRDVATDVARASVGSVGSLVGTARRGVSAATDLTRLTRNTARVATRIASLNLDSPLYGSISTRRSYDWTTVPFEDVAEVRRAFGGTINHVVLAAVLAGYRDLLLARGMSLEGRTLRIPVPVALRPRDASGQPVGDGSMMTKASGLIANLPLDVEDPAARLAAVRTHLDELKDSGETSVLSTMQDLSGPVPTLVLAAALRVVSKQRAVGPVVTNVPGPRETLYLLGGEITHIWSYAPVFPPGSRTAVSVYSYGGVLHVAVNADRKTVPDVDVVVSGIRQGVEDLLTAARAHTVGTPSGPASAAGGQS